MELTNKVLFGKVNTFAIECTMFKNEQVTEIAMYIHGKNILEFERDGVLLTTRWNLDDLVEWMKNFLRNMKNDPYPVECQGTYAAVKDMVARDFETDDDDEFDAYYDKLDEWNISHRWHYASNGAILADVYFQMIDEQVEISWNNQNSDVIFKEVLGGDSIPKEAFIRVVNDFLKFYEDYWFNN